MDRAADRGADVARNALLEAADIEQRWNEGEQEDDDEEAKQDEKAAIVARARRRGVGRCVEISLVVVRSRLQGVVKSNFADGLF